MLFNVKNTLSRLKGRLIYGGDDKVFYYEGFVIFLYQTILTENDAGALAWQLNKLDLAQHNQEKRLVTFYDLEDINNRTWDEKYLLSYNQNYFEHKIKIKIKMIGANKELNVKINIQNGGFFGLKFMSDIHNFFADDYWFGKIFIRDCLTTEYEGFFNYEVREK